MDGLRFSLLIVDDDEDDRMIIDEAFMEIGYAAEVKKFIDGEDLMQYLGKIESSVYPSLIVLDNTLPKDDAANILTRLKHDDRYNGIPVIVYSTSMSPQKQDILMQMGAYSCIEKGALMGDVIKVAEKLRDLAEANIKEPNHKGHP